MWSFSLRDRERNMGQSEHIFIRTNFFEIFFREEKNFSHKFHSPNSTLSDFHRYDEKIMMLRFMQHSMKSIFYIFTVVASLAPSASKFRSALWRRDLDSSRHGVNHMRFQCSWADFFLRFCKRQQNYLLYGERLEKLLSQSNKKK